MSDRLPVPIPAGTSVSEAVQKILDEATDEQHLEWALGYIDARYRPHTEAIRPDEVLDPGEARPDVEHPWPPRPTEGRIEARLRVINSATPSMDRAARALWEAMREELGE